MSYSKEIAGNTHVRLLGKNGEGIPNKPATIYIESKHSTIQTEILMQSDANGEIVIASADASVQSISVKWSNADIPKQKVMSTSLETEFHIPEEFELC
jgi:hypothetical protein